VAREEVQLKILVVDVGGNNVKLLATGQEDVRKVRSGPDLTPERMMDGIQEAIPDWDWDVATVGIPAPVHDGHPIDEPVNLGKGWVDFDYENAFGKPVRIINDAAMQALGSYEGGRMLFLGLGTGLGAALILEGLVQPLEIAHLPYRDGKTYEEFVGKRGQQRMGKKDWRKVVNEIVENLHTAFQVDEVVLGGGNSKQLKEIPEMARLGSNRNAFAGGFRLWTDPMAGKRSHRQR
jgi:predicted NBD/HSP70 family sugar kinase